MLSAIQKTIIVKAIKIRLANGEKIDDILNSYAKLTDEDKKEIREMFKK